jgi:hypothetical protein
VVQPTDPPCHAPHKNLEEDPWDGRRSRTYKGSSPVGLLRRDVRNEGTDFETRLKAIPRDPPRPTVARRDQ